MLCGIESSRAARAIPTLFLLLGGGVLLACAESERDAQPEVETAPAEISGRYEMSGVTTTKGSELKRKISGTVVLQETEGKYTASYEFKTKFPSEGPPVDADVIGVGEGEVLGRHLTGTAHTQIVVSAVPGVDTGFAFVPRRVSTRIVSDTVGEFDDDGMLSIRIESRAEAGEKYQSTRTRMRGRRIGDAGSASAAATDSVEGS